MPRLAAVNLKLCPAALSWTSITDLLSPSPMPGVIFSSANATGSVVISKKPADAEAARKQMEDAILKAKDKAAGFHPEEN